jgi:hypothetical protein
MIMPCKPLVVVVLMCELLSLCMYRCAVRKNYYKAKSATESDTWWFNSWLKNMVHFTKILKRYIQKEHFTDSKSDHVMCAFCGNSSSIKALFIILLSNLMVWSKGQHIYNMKIPDLHLSYHSPWSLISYHIIIEIKTRITYMYEIVVLP